MFVCVQVCVYEGVRIGCVCVCVCIYIFTCVHVYVLCVRMSV